MQSYIMLLTNEDAAAHDVINGRMVNFKATDALFTEVFAQAGYESLDRRARVDVKRFGEGFVRVTISFAEPADLPPRRHIAMDKSIMTTEVKPKDDVFVFIRNAQMVLTFSDLYRRAPHETTGESYSCGKYDVNTVVVSPVA